MSMFQFSLASLLTIALVSPSTALAYVQVSYVETVDTSTRNDVEQECRKKLGLRDTLPGPLLYTVRRCIRNYEQSVENQRLAERRMNRKAVRGIQQSARSTKLQESTTQLLQRQIQQGRLTRYRQAPDTKLKAPDFRTIRANNRQDVKKRERVIQEERKHREKVRREAIQDCRSETGAQRLMCIRDKVREELEE